MNRHERRTQQRGTRPQAPTGGLPPRSIQARIAQATHEAVCQVMHEDGSQCCVYYALVGSMLAEHVTQRRYYPMLGGLMLRPDRDDRAAVFEIQAHPETGEFHACFLLSDSTNRVTEMVDLSSRHYRSLTERVRYVAGARPPWTIDAPPDYVWCAPEAMPEWVRLRPDVEATRYLMQIVTRQRAVIGDMYQLARQCFDAHARAQSSPSQVILS